MVTIDHHVPPFIFFNYNRSDTIDQVPLFEKISKKLEAFSTKETNNKEATDGIFDFLSTISNFVQEKFDTVVSGDSDKKRFLKALSRIFALLLNTKVGTAEKKTPIIKIAIETYGKKQGNSKKINCQN